MLGQNPATPRSGFVQPNVQAELRIRLANEKFCNINQYEKHSLH